jgi:hypothetical protein
VRLCRGKSQLRYVVTDVTGQGVLPFFQWHPVCLEDRNSQRGDQTLAIVLSLASQDNLLIRLMKYLWNPRLRPNVQQGQKMTIKPNDALVGGDLASCVFGKPA